MAHSERNLRRAGFAIGKLTALCAAAAFLVIIVAGPDGAWAQQRPPSTVLNEAKTPSVPKAVDRYQKEIGDVRQGAADLGEFQATGDPAKAVEAAKKLKQSPRKFLGPLKPYTAPEGFKRIPPEDPRFR